jgi:hypothetical protein
VSIAGRYHEAAQVPDQLSLVVDGDPRQPVSGGVGVYILDPALMACLGGYLEAGGLPQSVLRVTVVRPGAPAGDDLPDVFGRHQVLASAVRFIPHFPFEPGLSYRATFDPRPFGRRELSEVQTLEFSLPKKLNPSPTEVKHIFPSSDCLPENLLRFYVCFSNPMQRGRVEAEISLLGPDGEPAPDVLYRAPVELWDRSMQYLTILLDPGRLKRGVGPNRELGPPLEAGQAYTLAVGSGMVDVSGRRLGEPFYKRFHVTDAVRKNVAIEQWKIAAPSTGSRRALVLDFPGPLDWALLSQEITVVGAGEQTIEGQIVIDQCESRWSFAPTTPWAAGCYDIRVSSSLEDVCGNRVIAAFDRPLRSGSDLARGAEYHSISFQLAGRAVAPTATRMD